MNPLDVACPCCHAKAGEKCRNYLGKGKQLCRGRGNVDYQKRHISHQQSAERKNAKERDALGPLFADQAPTTTPDAEYWHWRRNCGLAGERIGYILGSKPLELLRANVVRGFARRAVGEEWFAKLDGYARSTYPSPEYWYGFWKKILTGERHVARYEKVQDRKPGELAVRDAEWYQHAHMTPAEFYERFPIEEPPLPEPPDEAELCAYLDGLLARLKP